MVNPWHRSVALVLLTASLVGGAGWLVAARPAEAQVSPGPLSRAHEKLDGGLECFQCHGKGGGMREKCLVCHKETAWALEHGRGLHAREEAKKDCATCHPEHAGRDFALVHWSEGAPERFDHARAGYPLDGKHATTECRACHKPAFQRSEAAGLMKRARPDQSWLGLEQTCGSCHADPHRGSVGNECQRCHVTRAWKPAPRFDHAKSTYPLTGKHVPIECAKCHLAPSLPLALDPEGRPVPIYKPVPHEECSSCHKDAHAGRFGGACAKCHTTESWQRINEQSFEHDRTKYPLRGKHVAVACAKCHDPAKAWGKKPKFAACADCHKDAHAGTATLAAKPADCAACHAVQGFDASIYTVEQHRASAYPLEGRHQEIKCAACHTKMTPEAAARAPAVATALGTSRVRIRPAHDRCAKCHAEAHGDMFAKRADRGACEPCHVVANWRPSLVDVAAHQKYRFALNGGHRAAPCFACHVELKPGAPAPKPLTFLVAKARCENCHESPHGDQFARRRDRGVCEGCHTEDTFVPAARFDHNRDASYKLDGAHARTPCARCHVATPGPNGRLRTLYRPLSAKCESCHDTRPKTPLKQKSFIPVPGLPAMAAAHGLN